MSDTVSCILLTVAVIAAVTWMVRTTIRFAKGRTYALLLMLSYVIGGVVAGPCCLLLVFGVGHGGPWGGTWLAPLGTALALPVAETHQALEALGIVDRGDGLESLALAAAIPYGLLGGLVCLVVAVARRRLRRQG